MEFILASVRRQHTIVYNDDIIIFFMTSEQYLQQIEEW